MQLTQSDTLAEMMARTHAQVVYELEAPQDIFNGTLGPQVAKSHKPACLMPMHGRALAQDSTPLA